MTPTRIRQSRAVGWRLPPNTRSVARPGRWGNPFAVRRNPTDLNRWTVIDINDRSAALREDPPDCPDEWAAATIAVRLFELHTNPAGTGLYVPEFTDAGQHLTGWNLACWCPLEDEYGAPWPCHATSLLYRVNPELSHQEWAQEDVQGNPLPAAVPDRPGTT